MAQNPNLQTEKGHPDEERAHPDLLRGTAADLLRAQSAMIVARWVALPWALVTILARRSPPYPEGWFNLAIAVVGLLAVGNLAITVDRLRARTPEVVRRIALSGVLLDIGIVSAFIWVHTFDPRSALWAVSFIVPMEGALLYALRGALSVWAGMALLYTAREVWGTTRYEYLLDWNSILFRMAIGFLVALVAGLMARDLKREKSRLANALDRERELHDELRRLALDDELTGLRNRRGFMTLATDKLALVSRLNGSPSLLFIDVNGLKRINDKLGHVLGDQALVDTASVLRSTFRKSDLLGRIGGDEFCVLAVAPPGSTIDQAIVRLESAFEALNAEPNRPYSLSVSIGRADCNDHPGKSMEELLDIADRSMYEKKRGVSAPPKSAYATG